MSRLKLFAALCAVLVLMLAVTFSIPGAILPPRLAPATLPPMPVAASAVGIRFLETATVDTLEALAYAGGSPFKVFHMVHGAVLIEHGDDSLLFDTGLGRHAAQQFRQDMPFWLRPFMAFKAGVPAVAQLRALRLAAPRRILLSHAHWDHASGLTDFPQSEVWLTQREYAYLQSLSSRGPGQVFASQVDAPDIRWHAFALDDVPYAGFDRSLDLYGDGTVVAVDLSGHSPGSVGLFVNTRDARRYLFVGDAAWSVDAVRRLRTKFWLPSLLLDHDRQATADVVAKLHNLMRSNPDLQLVPAHDRGAWR